MRVEVSRLRAALLQYHEIVGEKVKLRIELPKGNYVPHFAARDRPLIPSKIVITPAEMRRKPEGQAAIPAIVQPKRRRFTLVAGAVAGAAAMAGAIYLSVVQRFPSQPVIPGKECPLDPLGAGFNCGVRSGAARTSEAPCPHIGITGYSQ